GVGGRTGNCCRCWVGWSEGDGRRQTGDGRNAILPGIPVFRLPSPVSLRLRHLEPFPHHRPVHHIPPRGDVVGAAVLVLEVIGVLPHVTAQDDSLARHHGTVLVGRALDRDGTRLVARAPAPASADPAHARLLELFFEAGETTEALVDRICQGTGRLIGSARSHD